MITALVYWMGCKVVVVYFRIFIVPINFYDVSESVSINYNLVPFEYLYIIPEIT